jgi:hypothetical protein
MRRQSGLFLHIGQDLHVLRRSLVIVDVGPRFH